MTTLHDPEGITHAEINQLKSELKQYNYDLWVQVREKIAQAWINGVKYSMEKGGK